MGVYLRSKWYWYKRTIDKTTYYRSLKIRKGQESFMSARIAQVEEDIIADHFGLKSPASNRDILFSEFLPIYEKRKTGKASLDKDIQRLRSAQAILGNKRLAAYRMDDFQALEKKLLDGHAHATVNRYMQVLHHFFEIAIRERAIAKNPLDDYEYFVESQGGRRALSDGEIRTLFAALRKIRDGAIHEKRDQPIHRVLHDVVLFGLYTGARLNEIVQLRHTEIDGDVIRLKVSQVKFRRRGRQAAQKEKMIYVPPEALKIVHQQPPCPGDYVFYFRRRDRRVVSKAIWQLSQAGILGVPGFTFHALRHTWITRVSEITDTPTVRKMAWHSDIRTTLRYTHTDDDKMRDVATKLGTIIRPFAVSD